MTFLHDAVYLALALCEASADGSGACVVRTVVLIGLRTAVAQQQPALLQGTGCGITVHYLAVHGDYGRERHHATPGGCYAGDAAADFLLRHPRAHHLHGRGVHLVAYGAGALYLGYLLCRLHGTLVYHRHYQLQAGLGPLL